ncbi:hypothetical protein F5Y00DRAFT_267622 [Daldinia vernicosa]|uniref:uncharacterized protein n=1 Tax=Daldinia vernicosa TaxID=114800 RepID=UPI002007E01D|nr:uncharacterized protein F5Y00DRAFT_267622 [Daldinia vernicosa]KAI0851377.1 hypothetical protein F5Y00DRAFT_267622 [Daldinia vernicosa]
MPHYTRDQYVAIINDFYTFLTKMYIADSALKHPPEGGWPNITPENCSGFGKNEFVVDLLKHLPYIQGGQDNDVDIYYKCNVLDYSTVTPEQFSGTWIKIGEIAASTDEPIPAHTVVIAEGHESGGVDLLLDTEKGTIIEEIIRHRRGGEWDVMEYFGNLKRKYEGLQTFHIPGTETIQEVPDIFNEDETATPEKGPVREDGFFFPTERDNRWIRHIYRSHGWPGPEYRRDECMEAIIRYKAMREGSLIPSAGLL